MPTQKPRRRQVKEVNSLQFFPPEGLSEPFKPSEIVWTPRAPFGTDGINKAVTADQLSPGQATRLENFRSNLGSIEPAWGTNEVGSAKVSPDEILAIGLYKEVDGTSRTFRIDEDDLQVWDNSSWTTVTGAGDAMTGDETNPIRAAMILDRLIWVNGVDEAKTWVQGDANYSDLSNSTNKPLGPRFIIGFADRVVVADVTTSGSRNTQRIDWSALADPTDFDASSAGGVTLYDGQVGAPADDIMGLAEQGNFLIVVRRNSIWLGLRTGESAAPIEFSSAVQGYGALAEGSVADLGSTGVAYLGKDNVYLFRPGLDVPIPIGLPIRDRIFDLLDRTNLDNVRSAYVPQTQEYWLFIPESGATWATRAFIFSVERFNNSGTSGDGAALVWTERLFTDNVSAAGASQSSGLGATYTDQKRNLMIGTDVGELFEIDETFAADNSQTYDCFYESPQFSSGPNLVDLSKINIIYKSGSRTQIKIEYSVDGGDSWTVPAQTETLPKSTATREISFHVPSGVNGDTIMFRITHNRPDQRTLNLIGYRLGLIERGPILGR